MSKTNQREKGVQSLGRGLEVLHYLVNNGASTASKIAEALGVHQSSASRLLNSLMQVGFVKKPSFKEFSVDYGILEFANLVLDRLPAARAADKVCLHLSEKTGYGVAVGMLRNDRLLNLGQSDPEGDLSLRFLVPNHRPLHRSSIGLVMAWQQGPKHGSSILKTSMEERNEKGSADELLDAVHQSILKRGFFYYERQKGITLNVAIPLVLDGEPGSLALFSRHRTASPEEMTPYLQEGMDIMSQVCKVSPTIDQSLEKWSKPRPA